jgi:hypothetical protein
LKSANNKAILSKKETCSIFEELILIETHLQNTYFSFENYRESLFISRDSILKFRSVMKPIMIKELFITGQNYILSS